MPSLKGSPPFSLSSDEWITLGKHFGLALIGCVSAFATSEAIPTLKDHVGSDLGALIVALIAAGLPVVIHWVSGFFIDTQKLARLVLIGVAVSLVCATPAWAQSPAPVINLPIVGSLTWMQWAAIAVAVVMGFLHKDSLANILRSVANVLDPQPVPGPVPTPTPGPAPTPSPLPLQDLITQILNIVNQFKKAGNDAAAVKAQALLEDAVKVA